MARRPWGTQPPAPLPELRTTGLRWNRGDSTPDKHLPLPTASHRAVSPGCTWACAVLPTGGPPPSRGPPPFLPHKPHFFPPLPPRNTNIRWLLLPGRTSQRGQTSPPHRDVAPDLDTCSGRQGGRGWDGQRCPMRPRALPRPFLTAGERSTTMCPRNPLASEWMWFSPKPSPEPAWASLTPPRTAQAKG